MTNEEALKIAKSTNPLLIGSVNEEEKMQYVERIISALESIERITAERDAAIADLKEASRSFRYHSCPYCKYAKDLDISKEPCHSCNYGRKNWEWRGIQK